MVLLWCSSAIDGDTAGSVEVAIFRFLNDLPGWLTPPVWVAMQFGNMIVVPIATAGALLVRRWALAASFFIVGAGKFFGSKVIKDLVHRHRPGYFLEDVTLRAGTSAGGLAFVSGHATIAVAVAAISSHYLGRRGRIVVWTLAILVCVGRIYVGAHLPLDVIGGAALGVMIGGLLSAALAWIDPDPPRLHRLRAKRERGGER